MPLDIPYNFSTVLIGATLVAFTSIRDVSGRLVASSDIRKQAVRESDTITEVKGDECTKLDAGIVNGEDDEDIDVGILGCGEALTCLEDESSTTGARCVDFGEVSVYDKASCRDYGPCSVDSDCCGDKKCEVVILAYPNLVRNVLAP